MKLHYVAMIFALGAGGFAAANAADPVAEAAKVTSVEKTTTRQEARAAQKASIAEARKNGGLSRGEADASQNIPPPKMGTRESRKAESAAFRADVKQQGKAGELSSAGDLWDSNKNTPEPVAGTRKERKAERKEIRVDLKEANRRGEIPKVTEAGLGVPK